ncbi:hypothetical protein ACQPZX_41445 [Actinoplanes sp. CA-142083]|uniref:hypothetical protein n=1 Tax=Actinoplanes sp. CA-142083 TaxID=3239903 RepID=UPI003D913253
MTSRELVAPRVLAVGTASIATATTVNVDFGTPDDVLVAVGANFKQGDRLVCVITASTAGTTDSTSFSIQDAPDSAGSIGTPATAVTTTLPAAATGNQYVVAGIQLQPGRPWIRVRATRASGTTDTLVVRAVLLAIPHNL